MLDNQCQSVPISYLLIIEATASAGGVAIFGEAVSELVVQRVSQSPRDTFPGHNQDDDDSVGTVMTSTLTNQTQQLLFLAATTDHLTGNRAYHYFRFDSSRGDRYTPWDFTSETFTKYYLIQDYTLIN